MNNQKVNDALLEELLKQLIIDRHHRELTEIPSDILLAERYTFSSFHIKRMNKLFLKEKRKERYERWKHNCKKGVAILAVGITIFSVILYSMPDVKAAVNHVLIKWYDTFTKFISEQTSSDINQKNFWYPTYIPDGYSKILVSQGDITMIRYNDTIGDRILFTYLPESGSLSVNNENVEYTTVIEKGIIYHIFTSTSRGTSSTIIWDNNGYRFSVVAELSTKELLQIALSVQKEE